MLLTLGDYSQYSKITYPAGELQVRIKPELVSVLEAAPANKVLARVRTAEQVVELLLLIDAVYALSAQLELVLPYLPYARADRRFAVGDCWGLSAFLGVFPDVSITTLDVHSNVAENFGVNNIEPYTFIQKAIEQFAERTNCRYINVLFPDKGACDRYGGRLYGRMFVHHASKVRDPETGKFLSFEVPDKEVLNNFPTLIIDDICDGGGTFIGIAEALRAQGSENVLGLYVTHGIFSKGLTQLWSHFAHIFTTDSFSDYSWVDFKVTVYSCLQELINE